MPRPETVLILDNIRSAHNVGSIFRTADAAGVIKIFLAGYTPCPVDKFKRPNKEITKTALGAEKTTLWEYLVTTSEAISKLKKADYQIIALEQAPTAIDYRQLKPTNKIAIILGNEVGGIAPEILDKGDLIAEIPMRGRKESLNVAVAVGIVLFHWLGS